MAAENFVPAAWASRERTRVRIEAAIGTMITAVAVLETNAEIRAEAAMRPSTICAGFVPTARMVSSATRRCRLAFSVARPRMTPPITRNTTELA